MANSHTPESGHKSEKTQNGAADSLMWTDHGTGRVHTRAISLPPPYPASSLAPVIRHIRYRYRVGRPKSARKNYPLRSILARRCADGVEAFEGRGRAGMGGSGIADKPAGSSSGTPAGAPQRGRFFRKRALVCLLAALLAVMVVVALGVGRYPVPFGDALRIAVRGTLGLPLDEWSTVECNTVLNTRLPRVLAAMLIGAALAVSGASYQGIFKNPMVSPDLLGVSSGACVGAAIAILLGLGGLATQGLAFVCAVGAVAAACTIPRLFRSDSVLMLVLAGIVVSGFCSSVLGFLKFIADPNSQLADIVFWTMGSLNSVNRGNLVLCAPAIVLGCVVLVCLRWRFNVLALSDAQAHYLGTGAARLRLLVIGCATLVTASSVCLSGTIGWVGLVVPHMSRLVVGSDNRFVVPASALFGALFLLVADTLARTLSMMSIPISVITGIVGAPLFVALLLARKKAVR